MLEPHKGIVAPEVRIRPESVSDPKLAQHINLFLDSMSEPSQFLKNASANLSPLGKPYRRILLWGAPGVGKAQTLSCIVGALGPERALLLTGAELSQPVGMARAVDLLREAKSSGRLAVLAITDYNQSGDAGLPHLFDPIRPEDAGEDSQEKVQRGEDAGCADSPDARVADIFSTQAGGNTGATPDWIPVGAAGSERLSPSAARRSALAILKGHQPRTMSETSPDVARLLSAVQQESVPALVICSTNSHMSDPSELAAVSGMFDLVAYAPLPTFSKLESAWEAALEGLPNKGDVNANELAALSEGLTEGDIHSVVRRAVSESYVQQRRPLSDLQLGQADLLAPLLAKTPLFERWASPSDPRRPELVWSGGEPRMKAPPIPVVAADLDRMSRGKETRELVGPEALRQAALGELSAQNADNAEGGWDSLLNGGLG